MKRLPVLLLLAFLVLAGCAPNMGPKETGGTLLGAGTGALLGSAVGHGHGRLVAVAVGTLAGALIGQSIGQSLDQADRLAMQQNAQYALENTQTDQATTWRNPDTGHSGTFTPTRTYKTAEGQYCREYTQTVQIGGEEQQAYGTACRQPDGTWKIIQ
jgi:surface antigen